MAPVRVGGYLEVPDVKTVRILLEKSYKHLDFNILRVASELAVHFLLTRCARCAQSWIPTFLKALVPFQEI